jgi:uncharacterized protein (DUF4415 family)
MPRLPLTDEDGNVRELNEADLRLFKPMAEVLQPELSAMITGRRRPGQRGKQKAPTKKAVYLRLNPEVVAHFKAKGKGWQTRINQTLEAIIHAAG